MRGGSGMGTKKARRSDPTGFKFLCFTQTKGRSGCSESILKPPPVVTSRRLHGHKVIAAGGIIQMVGRIKSDTNEKCLQVGPTTLPTPLTWHPRPRPKSSTNALKISVNHHQSNSSPYIVANLREQLGQAAGNSLTRTVLTTNPVTCAYAPASSFAAYSPP